MAQSNPFKMRDKLLKVYNFIAKDDEEQLFNALKKFYPRSFNAKTISGYMHYILREGAVNCFTRLISSIDFKHKVSEFLLCICSEYQSNLDKSVYGPKYAQITRLMLNHYNVDMNSLMALKEAGSTMPYILILADTPEIFNVCLCHGFDLEKKFSIENLYITKTDLIDLEEALTLMHETSKIGEYLISRAMVQELKLIQKEKKMLESTIYPENYSEKLLNSTSDSGIKKDFKSEATHKAGKGSKI